MSIIQSGCVSTYKQIEKINKKQYFTYLVSTRNMWRASVCLPVQAVKGLEMSVDMAFFKKCEKIVMIHKGFENKKQKINALKLSVYKG